MARRRSPRRPPSAPLENRLPNPPPVFVGREREREQLSRALERSPVALLVGPGGIGKTTLALRALHDALPDRVAHALYVGLPPDEPVDQLRLALVRLLAELEGSEVDLDALKGEPEAMTAAAIDLAEASERVILLDDLHHGEPAETAELLTQLAAYARRSRWIATSRAPMGSAGVQLVELGGMDDAELGELARALEPSAPPDAVRRAVQAAGGSPWLVQQFVSMGASAREVTRQQLLAELPERAASFLEALSVLRAPLPAAEVASFAPLPDAQELSLLERRGLTLEVEGGVRLHDVMRGLFFEERDPRRTELGRRAAGALSTSTVPESIVEAARLWAELDEGTRLAALLDERGGALLAEGFAPRLWRVVANLSHPGLVQFRLRCAAELGNATALSAVDQPREPDAAERLAWAHTLYAQGAVGGARAEADQARADAATAADAPGVVEATLLLARCAIHEVDLQAARSELGGIEPDEPVARTRRDALLALCAALEGDRGPADALASRVRAEGTPSGAMQEALSDLAAALEAVARSDAADELLDRVLATPRGGRASLLVARQALVLRARIRLEAGELVEVAELLETVRPFARAPSILRPFVLELDTARAFGAGELEGLEVRLETALRESRAVDARCHARVAATALRLARERGSDLGAPVVAASPESVELDLLAGRADGTTASTPRHHVVADLTRATEALASGEPGLALEIVDNAARAAAVAEQRLLGAETLALACDATACAGMHTERIERAEALAELAGWMFSERWRARAELMLHPGSPAVLERLAASDLVEPRSARRARAMLGQSPPLDAVDASVVNALRAELGGRIETLGGISPDGWRPGWGLDARHHAVWLPDGRTVDLSSRALLWRILVTMADGGGAASKEQLVLAAWQEREYHPARHDAKLHVSMRKLRSVVEDDPSQPERVLTADDGYRLGGVVRRLTP